MITVAKGDRQVYRFGADPGADSKRLIFAKQVCKLEEPRARRRQTRRRESGGCLMAPPGLGWESTWTEDRATQRCDPRAIPSGRDRSRGEASLRPAPFVAAPGSAPKR